VCNLNRYLCYELYNLSWVVFLLFFLQTDDFPELGKMFRQYIAREGDPFVLDIDLDFFSTRNPFRGLYENADLYSHLQELYNFQRPEDEQDPKVGSVILKPTLKVRKFNYKIPSENSSVHQIYKDYLLLLVFSPWANLGRN